MATIQKATGRQYPLVASAVLNLGTDGAVNTAGVVTRFNAAGTSLFDLIPLPPFAKVISGEVAVEVASDDTGAATISVGDSVQATRYLPATSTKSVGRTALTLTGFRGNGEDLRLTLVNGGGGTVGVVTLSVTYTIENRAHEVQTS